MTTQFKNQKPIYMLSQDVNWYIWYDNDEEVWVCSRGSMTKDKTYLQNESCLPQYGEYENEILVHKQTTANWNCVEI